MSEDQLKAVETEASAQSEEGDEEISEEDLEGVAGGVGYGVHGNSSGEPLPSDPAPAYVNPWAE